jgi:nucleoside 2-deoxyribosyltransferase
MSKRIFIAFAIEDERYRDFLRGQAKNENSPFEFTDMSAKEPWDEQWKTNCRTRIRGCDGVIALISKNTPKADGQVWEIQCAYDEKKPVMLMWVSEDRPSLPAILRDKRINLWSWDNIKSFISRL